MHKFCLDELDLSSLKKKKKKKKITFDVDGRNDLKDNKETTARAGLAFVEWLCEWSTVFIVQHPSQNSELVVRKSKNSFNKCKPQLWK